MQEDDVATDARHVAYPRVRTSRVGSGRDTGAGVTKGKSCPVLQSASDRQAYVVLPAPPDTVLVRQPLVSLDARYLAQLGFVQPWADVGLRYFAPTAATLVSQPFRETHCFSVARSDETGEIGLEFAPLPDRNAADVEGVLWLNENGDPRLVEFRFTHLEELLRRHEVPALTTMIRDRVRSLRSGADARVSFGRTVMDGEFGGELEFEKLDAGIWITRHWELRIPIMWHTATWTRGANSRILEVSGQPVALERRRRGTVTAVLAPEAIADDSTFQGSLEY